MHACTVPLPFCSDSSYIRQQETTPLFNPALQDVGALPPAVPPPAVPKMGFQYRASRKKEAKKRSKNSKGEDCVEVRYCDIPGMSKEVLRNMGNAKYRPVKLPYYKYKDLDERYNVASDNESIVTVDSDLLPNTNPESESNPDPEPSAGLPSGLFPGETADGEGAGEGKGKGEGEEDIYANEPEVHEPFGD